MDGAEYVGDVNADAFGKALDNIIDHFSDDFRTIPLGSQTDEIQQYDQQVYPFEDEELRRAQETYNRLTADARENDSKRMKLQLAASIPKVMKNDIRRYYSKMFMNTMNSADFINIQDYYNTFMCGSCKFVTEHAVNPEFCIPKLMVACGPRVMAHYTLGCFVMFPDMTMIMRDSRIVTSNSWTGTKIVMDMEIRATKSTDIDMSDWIPQVAALEQAYKDAQHEKDLTMMAVTDVSGSATVDDTGTCATGALLTLAAADCNAADPSTLPSADATNTAANAAAAAEGTATTSGSCKRKADDMDEMSCSSRSTTSSTRSNSSTSSTSTHSSHRTNSSCSSTESTSTSSTISATGNTDLIALNSQQDYRQSYIPEAYIQALFGRAKPRQTPQQILIQGEIILYLDENNHIQHIKQSMVQKSGKGWGSV